MTSKSTLIYFSPTRTTKKILEEIASGLGNAEIERVDLTRMREGSDAAVDSGVAVIGIPVYAGRVPELFLERIEKLTAAGVPAVLVAVYGNRAVEDALVELRDAVCAKGFCVVAAAAFVAEHSYATPEYPIAAGRPDAADLEKAREFGISVARLLQGGAFGTPQLPGDVPYKERLPLTGIAPETDQAPCTLCASCAGICPGFAIEVTDRAATDAAKCFKCCACTRACPAGARKLEHPAVAARREMLVANCPDRKEPFFYL